MQHENDPPEVPEVDTSLIDAMFELTPEDRLRQNDRMLRMIEELRHGVTVREARAHLPAR